MKSITRNIINDILDFFIPPVCHICGSPLQYSERFLCPACITSLKRTNYLSGYTGPQSPAHDNPMESRLAGKFPFLRATGHFFYTPDSAVASLIHDFKYRNFPSLAGRLGEIMADELMYSGFFNGIDYIMPVPLHWTKRLRRGYNQTERIAIGISKVTGIEISEDFKATRSHRTQTHLTPQQRLDNTAGIFRLTHPQHYHRKHILLIDDVCTTGATLTSAAQCILANAPNATLSVLTLAVTV